MKFITPSYEILSEDFTRENVIKAIARAARVCYQSEPKTEDADVKLMQKLLKMGHEAMIEHGPQLSVRLVTCRGVTHEIVRNRLFSFAQESTRYVKYGKEDENGNKQPMLFMLPPWIQGEEREILLNNEWKDGSLIATESDADKEARRLQANLRIGLSLANNLFLDNLMIQEVSYAELLNEGWKPQQAREILGNSLKTEIVITGNIRQWRHFFELRCDKPAHPQMREWTIPLFNQLREDIPELWNDIAERINIEI